MDAHVKAEAKQHEHQHVQDTNGKHVCSHMFSRFFIDNLKNNNLLYTVLPHRIHGAAIYGNIYHQYTPVMLALIYHIYIYPIDPSWLLGHRSVIPSVPRKTAGPSTIAAIMVESIPGSAGVLIPAVGFMEGWKSGVRPGKVWALVCS